MIRALPQGVFSGDYFVERDDQAIGDLKISRPTLERLVGGTPVVGLHLEGVDYELSAEVASTGLPFLGKLKRLVLRQGGREIAWAEPSNLYHFFTVHWDGRQVDLKGHFWAWPRRIDLVERGAVAGSISRGYFLRRTTIGPPRDVPLPVQAFLLWLACWRWKRAESTA
jgi:hypothetical protein